jgi:hypothetical protein
MNNKLERGDSRKEQEVNSPTTPRSMTVLRFSLLFASAILSLLMHVQAGEPPAEGEPVDIGRWAYVYRQNAKDNPWETRWLEPNDKMLCGFLLEEEVAIAQVEVELPAGSSWPAGDLQVMMAKPASGPWCDPITWLGEPIIKKGDVATALKPIAGPASPPAGNRVLAFDGKAYTCKKLAIMNVGGKPGPVPLVRVYSAAPRKEPQAPDLRRWSKPQVVEIEWGFQDKAINATVEGRVEAF